MLSTRLSLVIPVTVALLAISWTFAPRLLQQIGHDVFWTGNEPLVAKYESELVKIALHPLLIEAAADYKCLEYHPTSNNLTHVELVLGQEQQLHDQDRVFFMLNGQNEGTYLAWTHHRDEESCLLELARTAALYLGADPDWVVNGLRLFSVHGLPILTAEEFDTFRIAHILLDGQLWVWPGVKVGYVRKVEGYTLTTQSLKPKVFTVEGFFTQKEADAIIAEGIDHLKRSPVDSVDAVNGYHADRTSYTAFLNDSEFTRDLRVRSARLARLPSPGYAERLQLVRYETGQFYRKHLDYFESKEFVSSKQLQFETWIQWASSKIDDLREKHGDGILPVEFLPGGAMFPDVRSTTTFQHALLKGFMEEAEASDFFWEHADLEWRDWIDENLEQGAEDIMGPLLSNRGYMLPFIVASWEKRAGLPELVYSFSKSATSGVSHYFRWIRWAKERVQMLVDTEPGAVPKRVRPEGEEYPTFYMSFQNRLANYILEDYTQEFLDTFAEDLHAWFVENKDNDDVLLELLRTSPPAFDLAVESWTKRAGNLFTYTKPKYLHHFEPNRFVTLFLYLNECPEGGETVFFNSKERLVTGIEREDMTECSEGMALPPVKLTASLFYSQTPINDLDPSSLHGGCPPTKGVKFGANSFMWNSDADEGTNLWGMGGDFKSTSNIADTNSE